MTADLRLDPGVARYDLLRALREMPLIELQWAAARYAPAALRHRKADLIAAIAAALASEALLDDVVDRLSALELALLAELARRGGVASASELATFAALRGHAPPPIDQRGRGIGHPLGAAGTAAYLAGLVDGALVVRGDHAAAVAALGPTALRGDRVLADPRLLARVWARASAEAVPAALPLALEPAPRVPESVRHPIGVVIELLDVLHLVADAGGVAVTKDRTIARPFVKRLTQLRPHLAPRLEPLLHALFGLHLLRPPTHEGARQPWTVDGAALLDLLELPTHTLYAAVVDAAARHLDPRVDEAWRHGRYVTTRSADIWRVLPDALASLPPHAARLDAVAEGLWRQVLVRVVGWSGGAALGGASPTGEPRPRAIDAALAGPLATLGLVDVAGDPPPAAPGRQPRWTDPGAFDPEPPADERVLAPGRGLPWYAAARSVVHGHRVLDAAAWTRGRGLDPTTGTPLEASLLVQPNFEVHAYLERLSSAALGALTCATVTRIDAHTAGFAIDRWSVHRALGLGHDIASLLDALRAHAGSLPDNVAQAMRDWARRRDRLRVTVGAHLVEYADAASRDAALTQLGSGRAVADRFALLGRDATAPRSGTIDYREPPPRAIAIAQDGTVALTGALDLPGRALLHRITQPAGRGRARFDADAIRAGALGPGQREVLAARVQGPIPPPVDVLLRAWAGEGPVPAIERAALFHHPRASAWAQRPDVAAHLGAALNDTTYLVAPGAEMRLAEALRALGVAVTGGAGEEGAAAAGGPAAGGSAAGGSAAAVAGDPSGHAGAAAPAAASAAAGATGLSAVDGLIAGLSTRKTRERLEEAIAAGLAVELRYADERERYDRYGSVKRSKGRLRTARVFPQEVVYRGSLPYLRALDADGAGERWIRIGYVDALALRTLAEVAAKR